MAKKKQSVKVWASLTVEQYEQVMKYNETNGYSSMTPFFRAATSLFFRFQEGKAAPLSFSSPSVSDLEMNDDDFEINATNEEDE